MFDLLRLRWAACGLSLLLGALVAPSPYAQELLTLGRRCATPEPNEAERQAFATEVQEWRQHHPNPEGGLVTIPIAFHVVHAAGTGNIPQQMIDDQIDVLNDAFLPMGYRFVLASLDRTDNPTWYNGCYQTHENAMKAALAIDPAHFLNFYTCRPTAGILGYAYLPDNTEGGIYHGVVVLDQSLPGGTAFPYHLGDTGTHEVGHWAGLLHTFDGGCNGGDTPPGCETGGDQVCDTAAEASPAFTCQAGRDTCPTNGPDPIHNFMDYPDDACMFEFTPGQTERSLALMTSRRPTIMNASGAFAAPDDLNFGDVLIGEAVTQPVFVVNLSDEALEVTSITSNNPVFTAGATSLTVAPSSAEEVLVTFTPDGVSPEEGTLSLETTDPEIGTLTVELSGNGVPLAPVVSLSRTGFLASAAVGGTATVTFTIENSGLAQLDFDFGSIPPWITSVSPDQGAVAPGGEQTVTLTLSAGALGVGVEQDLLNLNTNDPEQEQFRLHVVFAVGGALPPPALLSPLYGDDNVPTEAVLAWLSVASAFAYEVQVAPDEGFTVITFSGSSPVPTVSFTADAGATLFWRVRSINGSGTASDWTIPFTFTVTDVVANEPDGAVAGRSALGTAFPNPTRGEVTVPFTLDAPAAVTLHVYDATGRRVGTLADGEVFAAGAHALAWSAERLPAGVYLVRFTAGSEAETGRLVLVR